MPRFGKRSEENLSQCHEDIQRLFREVVKYYDCSVICGHRGEKDQNEAYHSGRSKLKFPESKHNSFPSEGVDVVPYFKNRPHVRWDDKEKFYEFAGIVQGIAATLGINIRWGGNWDRDDELHDQGFMDLPHYEIKS